MQKPLLVARQDFFEELAALINNSNLPMFVITDILEKVLSEAKEIAQRQYEQQKAQYEEALVNESKEKQDTESENQ